MKETKESKEFDAIKEARAAQDRAELIILVAVQKHEQKSDERSCQRRSTEKLMTHAPRCLRTHRCQQNNLTW